MNTVVADTEITALQHCTLTGDNGLPWDICVRALKDIKVHQAVNRDNGIIGNCVQDAFPFRKAGLGSSAN